MGKKMVDLNSTLIDIKKGKLDEYTNNTLTRLNKKLHNLQLKSSKIFNEDFNIDVYEGKNIDLERIQNMLKEWRLIISDVGDKFNYSSFLKIDETGTSECEFCGSKKGCKYLYKVENEKTKEYLWFGSQCIKILNIPVYRKGEALDRSELDVTFNEIEKTSQEYRESEFNKFFELCKRNNDIILKHKKIIPNVGFGNRTRPYTSVLDEYEDLIYSLYRQQIITGNIDQNLKGRAYELHLTLYSWSALIGKDHKYVTFVPSVDQCLNNIIAYSGIYKYLISQMIACSFKKEKISLNKLMEISNHLDRNDDKSRVIKEFRDISRNIDDLLKLKKKGDLDDSTLNFHMIAVLITIPLDKRNIKLAFKGLNLKKDVIDIILKAIDKFDNIKNSNFNDRRNKIKEVFSKLKADFDKKNEG